MWERTRAFSMRTEKKETRMKMNKRTLVAVSTAALFWLPISSCDRPSAQVASRHEGELCKRQLKTIYEAIQAYRRDHKDLPNWLSDLVPKYLPDTNALICPITRRTGRTHDFVNLNDPKLPKGYLYEFSPLPMGGIYGGGAIRMRDFKRRQMGYLGGEVAMVRCHLHQPVLNLAFSGHIYESGMGWEDNFTNVVPTSTWRVENLFPEGSPGIRPGSPAPSEEPAVNQLVASPAPIFTLPLLGGGTFDLAAHRGKDIVVLDFWASWCPPCRAAMPILAEISRDYADKGVRYFGVNLREKPETIRRYLKDAKLELNVPLDQDGSIGKKYGVTGIPTMVLIDKEGIVQKVQVGSSPRLKAELTRALDELIADSAPPPRPSMTIPIRPANVTPGMVDLSGHIHAALAESWHPGAQGNDLAGLSCGVQELQGVRFDIRGIVQLNGGGMLDMQGKSYPRRVQGIRVGRRCARLHVLHSAGWAVDDGTVVGQYVLHYSDGTTKILPIVYGEDVRDWWVGTDKVVQLKNAQVAWQGKTSNNNEVRLYKRTWENPEPAREVASIDFISTMTRCAPFLLAITTEP